MASIERCCGCGSGGGGSLPVVTSLLVSVLVFMVPCVCCWFVGLLLSRCSTERALSSPSSWGLSLDPRRNPVPRLRGACRRCTVELLRDSTESSPSARNFAPLDGDPDIFDGDPDISRNRRSVAPVNPVRFDSVRANPKSDLRFFDLYCRVPVAVAVLDHRTGIR